MGFWGVQNFENDDAEEWANDLMNSPTLRLIPFTLKVVTEGGGEALDVSECSNALAAAEVVAALKGFPSPHLPPPLAAWLQKQPPPEPEWVELAHRAAKRIRADSDLQRVWDDAGYAVHWRTVVDDLIARLEQ
ncbi:MAG: DUF4259 domain-containing protein [Rudaea sp.]